MELLDSPPAIKRIEWKPVKICPLGDLQVGSEGFDKPKLDDYIAEALDAGAYFIGMGDFSDFLSPSNRVKLKNAGLYDTSQDYIEQAAEEGELIVEEMLAKTKGKWLGMVEGHHFYEFSDGTTTDSRLCNFLGCAFLGTTGMIRLQFVRDYGANSRPQVASCDLWMHHGVGGGQMAGVTLNRLQRAASGFHADVYFAGHDTRLAVTKIPYLELTGGGKRGVLRLRNKTKTLVATGSFMEGYCVGAKAGKTGRPRGGYVEQRMMTPTALGAAMVEITPKLKLEGRSHGYSYMDVRATI